MLGEFGLPMVEQRLFRSYRWLCTNAWHVWRMLYLSSCNSYSIVYSITALPQSGSTRRKTYPSYIGLAGSGSQVISIPSCLRSDVLPVYAHLIRLSIQLAPVDFQRLEDAVR